MGVNQSTQQLKYYGNVNHPYYGQVTAYFIKNEAGKFAMKLKQKVSKQQLEVYQMISKLKIPKLITYYGNQISKANKFANFISNGEEVTLFWQYLNFGLFDQINYLKQSGACVKEETLWQIVESGLQVSRTLSTHHIYLSFTSKKVYFSSGQSPKIFWADVLPHNMHRGYQNYLKNGQIFHSIYSPQQLLQMKRTERKQLDKQKCVLFNLGIVVLEAASKIDAKKLYNYHEMSFSQVRKNDAIKNIENTYSPQFMQMLQLLIQYFPNDRLGFDDLQYLLNLHYQRKNQNSTKSDIKSPQQQKYQKSTQKTQSKP